jgi:hypothetical protein
VMGRERAGLQEEAEDQKAEQGVALKHGFGPREKAEIGGWVGRHYLRPRISFSPATEL